MTAKSPKLKDIVLIAMEGDVDPGAEYLITPDEPVPIGRSAKGITLLDPMVSIQHAVVNFDLARGYVIQDLNSATGTWVDEECIKGESRPIGVGTILRFGDTVFQVGRPARIMPWMRVLLVAGLAVGMVAFGVWVLQQLGSDTCDISMVIKVHGHTHEVLEGDPRFLRTHGVSMCDVSASSKTTDYDNDGIDEVWLTLGKGGREALVTFPSGRRDTSEWVVLGVFPGQCVVREPESGTLGYFPWLDCLGTHWRYFEEEELDDGRVLPAGYSYDPDQDNAQDGVVVVYRPPRMFENEEKTPTDGSTGPQAGPLESLGKMLTPVKEIKVARMAWRTREKFGTFLLSRGITKPVHYVLCEDPFDRIPPQAVMENGVSQRLTLPCSGGIKLDGEIQGDVLAVALTPTGYDGLVDDMITYYSGDAQGLFLEPQYHRLRDVLRANPGYQIGGTKLLANPNLSDLGTLLDPVPDRPLAGEPGRLEPSTYPNAAPAAPAHTHVVLDPGMGQIGMEGCGALQVWTSSFEKRGVQAYLPGNLTPFSRVSEEGCGPQPMRLFAIDFGIGGTLVRDAMVGTKRVRAVVETRARGRGVEVVRYRIAYRDEAAQN